VSNLKHLGSNCGFRCQEAERIVDHENIQRSRLRVDARKWAAARLAPRKYGDRVEHDVKGGDFRPAILIQIGDGAPEPVEVSGKVIEEDSASL
jgi:terminase small subunit-like protein